MKFILRWFSGLFGNRYLARVVAERLRGEDLRKSFINRVVRSMKEHPYEWRLDEWQATHKSGVLVDARGYANKYGDPSNVPLRLHASITRPSFTLLTEEESETLGDAFDYLVKAKILESLGMDRT